MNVVRNFAFRWAGASLTAAVLCSSVALMQAQETPPPAATAPAQPAAPDQNAPAATPAQTPAAEDQAAPAATAPATCGAGSECAGSNSSADACGRRSGCAGCDEPRHPPTAQDQAKPAADQAKPAPAKPAEADENPFAPKPAPPLPPGMTGSNANDPRAKLKPGMYDAGETAMGMKHLLLLKKPEAFQLGSDQPDDPKVQKTLGQLGVGDASKMPKPMQMVIAQLAFANSDLAFQGTHLFQGNFYGVNIYDICEPGEERSLLTSLVCPGGQGDVSVYGQSAVHVGRDAERAAGLQRAGISAGASAGCRGMRRSGVFRRRRRTASAG